jgi:transposase-like protein
VTDKELDKNAARRLAIIRHAQEVTGNVAMTCRYYGISRQVFYRWLRRYETGGLAGLRDRSKRPAHCPHETPAEVVAKVIYLRTNYLFVPKPSRRAVTLGQGLRRPAPTAHLRPLTCLGVHRDCYSVWLLTLS